MTGEKEIKLYFVVFAVEDIPELVALASNIDLSETQSFIEVLHVTLIYF